jgi:DNA-binding HxlR family transcriptional regulator
VKQYYSARLYHGISPSTCMPLETLLNENTVIYALGSFFTGMASVILYLNLKVFFKKSPYEVDNSLAEAVVSEYSTRLDEFKKIIGELKAKVDTVELLALQQRPTSQASVDAVAAAATATVSTNDLLIDRDDSISDDTNQTSRSKSQISGGYQSDVISSTKNITPSQQLVHGFESNTRFVPHNTPDYILKLLSDKPRTSREIQNAIGRTREHTSRLMRKLYEHNLVVRDSNSKPFKYTITDAGRRQLLSHSTTREIASTHDMDIHSEPAPTQLNAASR